jgi:hypothetical protein
MEPERSSFFANSPTLIPTSTSSRTPTPQTPSLGSVSGGMRLGLVLGLLGLGSLGFLPRPARASDPSGREERERTRPC